MWTLCIKMTNGPSSLKFVNTVADLPPIQFWMMTWLHQARFCKALRNNYMTQEIGLLLSVVLNV